MYATVFVRKRDTKLLKLLDVNIPILSYPQFVVIWREGKEKACVERQRSVLEQQRSHLTQLGEQASRLKLELREVMAISEIRALKKMSE